MEDKMEKIASKGLAIKIIIPVLIVAVVIGIWFFKNTKAVTPPDANANPDFVLNVTKEFDLEQLKAYGLPIILDFGADYCPPCREMAPILKKLNTELQEKAIIKYIDTQEHQELTRNYPVSVIPTQVFFDKEGNPFVPSDPEGMRMNIYFSKDTNEHVFTTHEGGMTEDIILATLKEMGMEE